MHCFNYTNLLFQSIYTIYWKHFKYILFSHFANMKLTDFLYLVQQQANNLHVVLPEFTDHLSMLFGAIDKKTNRQTCVTFHKETFHGILIQL